MIQIKEYDENAFKGYQIKLKDGRFPSNDKEIVLSEESLKKSNKKIGDSISFNIGKRVDEDGNSREGDLWAYENEKIINATKKDFKIVGTIEKPGVEWNGSDAVVTGITYLDINNIDKNKKRFKISDLQFIEIFFMYLYIVEIPKYKNVIPNNIKLENSITNLTPLDLY